MYWKYQAIGAYKLLVYMFVFLQFCSYLQTFRLSFYFFFFYILTFFSKMQAYILNVPLRFSGLYGKKGGNLLK